MYLVMSKLTDESEFIYAQNDVHAIAYMIKNHGEAWRNEWMIRPCGNWL